MNQRERALDHKCPNCGAKVIFSPEIGKWNCNGCSGEYDLEYLKKYNNASSDENNAIIAENKIHDDVAYIQYHCKNCGAEIIADEQTSATFCVYCGNTAILKSKLSGKFAPSKVIPFKRTKQEAIDSFKSLYKGRPFMPKLFNKEENIEKITGVYIPFWLYSYESNGKMKGSATKITTWIAGKYTYTKTDIYDIDRDVTMKFERVPVDGSTRFSNDIMNTIEPFDYSEMVDYNHAYLSGFLAEKYDVESKDAQKEADSRVINSTKDTINESIGSYNLKKEITSSYSKQVQNIEYVLLPVWMVNVKYNNSFYTFAMNGQTGEFVGDIPVDKKKATLYTILLFIGLILAVIFISYIVFLGGK